MKLIEAIQKHNYELYWEINQPLNDKHIADMRKYAIRIYSNKHLNFVQPNFEIKQFTDEGGNPSMGREDLIFSDKFIEWEQKAYNVTIGELLSQALPRIFETNDGKTVVKREVSVLSHGLKVDLETPLYWL